MAKVVWSLDALADISEIGLFFERDSPQYAELIVNRLYSGIDHLEEFPMSGRIVPEIGERSLREVIVEGYRIIHEIEGDTVGIVAVISGRQDLRRKLAK